MQKRLAAAAFVMAGLTIPALAQAAQIVEPVAQTVTTSSVEDGIAAKFRGNLIQGSMYQLTFAAQTGSESPSPIDVFLHGKNIFSVTPGLTGAQDYTTSFKYYGDNTLTFSGLDGGAGNSIDNVRVSLVSVSAVPEPATWAMMLLGVGMTGGAIRAKRRRGDQKPALSAA